MEDQARRDRGASSGGGGGSVTTALDTLRAHIRDGRDRRLEAKYNNPFGNLPAITCADGFTMSVQASREHYCRPRNNEGPWVAVEVGLLSERCEALMPYIDGSDNEPTEAVYNCVPLEVVAAVIEQHGGFTPAPAASDSAQSEREKTSAESATETCRHCGKPVEVGCFHPACAYDAARKPCEHGKDNSRAPDGSRIEALTKAWDVYQNALANGEGIERALAQYESLLFAAAPELIRRARDADRLDAETERWRDSHRVLTVRAEKAEREVSRLQEGISAISKTCERRSAERDEARKECHDLRDEVSRLTADMDAMERRHAESVEAVRKRAEHAERERDEARAWGAAVEDPLRIAREERDELREALRKIADSPKLYESGWVPDDLRQIARAAIAKVGGGA